MSTLTDKAVVLQEIDARLDEADLLVTEERALRCLKTAIEGLVPMLIDGHRCDSTVCDACNAAAALTTLIDQWKAKP